MSHRRKKIRKLKEIELVKSKLHEISQERKDSYRLVAERLRKKSKHVPLERRELIFSRKHTFSILKDYGMTVKMKTFEAYLKLLCVRDPVAEGTLACIYCLNMSSLSKHLDCNLKYSVKSKKTIVGPVVGFLPFCSLFLDHHRAFSGLFPGHL